MQPLRQGKRGRMEGRDKGEEEGWSTRGTRTRGVRTARQPGRAGGLLKRASCMNREEVSSDSSYPKSI
eukprot:7865213-Pyramimonas_sp.AAC.1